MQAGQSRSEQRDITDGLNKDDREDPKETPRQGAFDQGNTLSEVHAETAAPFSKMATRLQRFDAFRKSLCAFLYISNMLQGDRAG